MSSSSSSSQSSAGSYFVISDDAMDGQQMDLATGWQYSTIIEDGDLTFDGKPLSALYEENRRLSATSASDEEEERRGRQRVRQEYTSSKHSHKN